MFFFMVNPSIYKNKNKNKNKKNPKILETINHDH